MKVEEEFMMFWDDPEDMEPVEALAEKMELKDLKRSTDIRGDKMRYGR